jgi:hypothetical protein
VPGGKTVLKIKQEIILVGPERDGFHCCRKIYFDVEF